MEKIKKENFLNDEKQHINIDLEDIVPEYYSNNFIIKWLFNKRQKIVLKYISKIKPNLLLDVGCGDGSLIKKIENVSPKIKSFGIDINKNVVKLNKSFNKKIFSRQDLRSLSFKNNNFDVVVCLDVLEHIKDLENALIEIKRVLKKNCYLITSEPTENLLYKILRFLYKGTYSQEKGPTAGAHYWNAKEVDRKIRSFGFTRISNHRIPLSLPLFDLFHINLYKKLISNENHNYNPNKK